MISMSKLIKKKKKKEGQDGPGFRQEFTRISLCLYSASSPHSLIPCLLTDQNFANNFLKGSLKERFYEIIPKVSEKTVF